VHRLGAGALDRVEQLLDVQVALAGRTGAEQVGLVGVLHVNRVAVELGIDRDRRDAQLATRAGDTDCDLASVGDQHLREHGGGHFTGPRPGCRRV